MGNASSGGLAYVPATGGAGGGIAAIIGGNTAGVTASVSSGTLVLAGGNNITLSQNGQSVSIIGGAGGAGFSAGVSGGNTSGSTGLTGTNLYLAGGNNITLSQSTGANGASVTISAFSQTVQTQASGNIAGTNTAVTGVVSITLNSSGLSFNGNKLAGTNTAITGNALITLNTSGIQFNGTSLAGVGSTITGNASITMNSAGIQFNGSGLAGTNTGATNASLTVNSSGVSVSVPATSSISATGWASISVNGSTISVGAAAPQLSFFQPIGPIQATTVTQNGNNSIQVYPAIAAFPFTASRVDMLASVSAAALAASTEAQTLSMYVGLYSLNGSTLSLATSGSQSYAWTNSSGGSSSVLTGLRRFSAPMNVNYTGGFDLFVGVMSNTTFVNTNGISLSNVVVAVAPVAQLNGLIGETTNNSKQLVPGQGFFSTTSAAMPVSMGLSAISGIGSASVNAYAVPVQFVNVTA